jgi:hypothetical protein
VSILEHHGETLHSSTATWAPPAHCEPVAAATGVLPRKFLHLVDYLFLFIGVLWYLIAVEARRKDVAAKGLQHVPVVLPTDLPRTDQFADRSTIHALAVTGSRLVGWAKAKGSPAQIIDLKMVTGVKLDRKVGRDKWAELSVTVSGLRSSFVVRDDQRSTEFATSLANLAHVDLVSTPSKQRLHIIEVVPVVVCFFIGLCAVAMAVGATLSSGTADGGTLVAFAIGAFFLGLGELIRRRLHQWKSHRLARKITRVQSHSA